MADDTQSIIESMAAVLYGLRPFDPKVNKPQDIGLGGPSTEYLATDDDPYGQPMNYPQVWWDASGKPHMLPRDDAYNQAISYELASGIRFPRYDSAKQAEMFAQHRSARGGAEFSPLGSILGIAGY